VTSSMIDDVPWVVLEQCAECGRNAALPRGFCALCGSRKVLSHAVRGRCTIWSITHLHRSPGGDAHAAPYGIALARLDSGVTMMVRVPSGLAIGDQINIERTDLLSAPRFIGPHPPG
jgi:uncharacterized OB-fold protein